MDTAQDVSNMNKEFENNMSDAAISWLEHARQYPQDLLPREIVSAGMAIEHISPDEIDYIFKEVLYPS